MSAEVSQVEGMSGKSVGLHVRQGNSTRIVEGTDLLVAAGRTPNTERIGLDLAGVELTQQGYIKVNERLETSAPDVWAIGECAGVLSSRTSHSTTFESSGTTLPAGIA